MSVWWSVTLTVMGVTGLFFTLKKKWWGQAIALGSQILWVVYAIKTQQWGFLGSAFAYGSLNFWGMLKWRKETRNAGK